MRRATPRSRTSLNANAFRLQGRDRAAPGGTPESGCRGGQHELGPSQDPHPPELDVQGRRGWRCARNSSSLGYMNLSIYLSVYLSVYLSFIFVYLSIYLSIYVSIYLSLYMYSTSWAPLKTLILRSMTSKADEGGGAGTMLSCIYV